MDTSAMFPAAPLRAGMYESFYLRTVSPEQPLGAWIRCTVRKPPGRPPLGSVWCTVFDARAERPFMHKLTSEKVRAPAAGWIAIGEEGKAGGGASLGPGQAHGSCGDAHWSLRMRSQEPELRHLTPAWLYRTPLPRTKLSSPAPAASFEGTLALGAHEPIELRGWPGMVGHNWGSEHAERWIWLHGIAFEEAPDAWLDLALGRVRMAGRMTPWLASGALSIDGRRYRLGGLGATRGTHVAESVRGCTVAVAGEGGLRIELGVEVPAGTAAGWRYADPVCESSQGGQPQGSRLQGGRLQGSRSQGGRLQGSQHDVINCSIAALELTVRTAQGAPRTLRTAHGGAYELGVRERDHGVPIAPFPDA